MKTKLFFFILLLVMGAGKGFAQSADSLLQKVQEARSLLANWDTIPGSHNDKVLAFMTGAPVQIGDSIRNKEERYLGALIVKTYHYKRYIQYNRSDEIFKVKLDLVEKRTT